MSTSSSLGAVLLLLGVIGLAGPAPAQDKAVWGDVDCAQSKIIAPSGLKCRATQEYALGIRTIGRLWAAFGTLGGVKLYYYVADVSSTVGRGAGVTTSALDTSLTSVSPQGKNATGFSALLSRSGADFLTFTSAAGEPCVGIRKFGPRGGDSGYKWILYATRCSPKGKPVSEQAIEKFITDAGYR